MRCRPLRVYGIHNAHRVHDGDDRNGTPHHAHDGDDRNGTPHHARDDGDRNGTPHRVHDGDDRNGTPRHVRDDGDRTRKSLPQRGKGDQLCWWMRCRPLRVYGIHNAHHGRDDGDRIHNARDAHGGAYARARDAPYPLREYPSFPSHQVSPCHQGYPKV